MDKQIKVGNKPELPGSSKIAKFHAHFPYFNAKKWLSIGGIGPFG
jgi:hypothetical protein